MVDYSTRSFRRSSARCTVAGFFHGHFEAFGCRTRELQVWSCQQLVGANPAFLFLLLLFYLPSDNPILLRPLRETVPPKFSLVCGALEAAHRQSNANLSQRHMLHTFLGSVLFALRCLALLGVPARPGEPLTFPRAGRNPLHQQRRARAGRWGRGAGVRRACRGRFSRLCCWTDGQAAVSSFQGRNYVKRCRHPGARDEAGSSELINGGGGSYGYRGHGGRDRGWHCRWLRAVPHLLEFDFPQCQAHRGHRLHLFFCRLCSHPTPTLTPTLVVLEGDGANSPGRTSVVHGQRQQMARASSGGFPRERRREGGSGGSNDQGTEYGTLFTVGDHSDTM